MKPLVYLAGPYTRPDPVHNTHQTVRAADEMLTAGIVTPFVPHLTLLWEIISPKPLQVWYEYDLEILARCDAVLRLAGESTGADAEVAFAQARDIPVFSDLEALYAWAEKAAT